MPEGFLSSEEYDEQAHKLYNDGDYDGALEMLKEGLSLYPNAVELYVGLGYARLAREEFAWARQAFERARCWTPPTRTPSSGSERPPPLRGARAGAQALSGGRRPGVRRRHRADAHHRAGALPRRDVRRVPRRLRARPPRPARTAPRPRPRSGYALHRLGDDVGAGRQIRRALRLDPDLHEARVYLGHLLYDRGDWEGGAPGVRAGAAPGALGRPGGLAADGVEADALALDSGDARLRRGSSACASSRISRTRSTGCWPRSRAAWAWAGAATRSVRSQPARALRARAGRGDGRSYVVRLGTGGGCRGTWHEIVRQMRDHAGFSHETLAQYMRRLAERWHEQSGVEIPSRTRRRSCGRDRGGAGPTGRRSTGEDDESNRRPWSASIVRWSRRSGRSGRSTSRARSRSPRSIRTSCRTVRTGTGSAWR
jgi:hypothetical protein